VVQQLDTPQRIYEQPANVFVAQFVGSPAMNVFEVDVAGSAADMYLDGGSFRLKVPEHKARAMARYLGSKLVLGVRPEHIDSRANGGARDGRVIKARVEVMETLGSEVVLYLQTGRSEFVARSEYDPNVRPGREIEVAVNLDRSHLFDPGTGQLLRAE
ncbi:MAG: ABC transporter ATP-binding protein, partial [Chloroflexi bacterium]|nr:ABC transporter ATP-binding protein [Chloroflexota bacterium]